MKSTDRDFYQVSLKLILKNTAGEILLMKAQDKDTYAGFYDLPGGRINVNEFTVPLPDIVQREVREEIGDVKYELNPKPVAVARHLIPASISVHKRDVHVLYLLYEGLYVSGDIAVSRERTGFIWADPHKIELEKFLKSGNLEGIKMYLESK
jgi:8-oxo-dGTP pyrophosphatase MutT (NUDIX family)